ncbi:unnamed protein product [Cochlearia groenlandica]
MERNSGRREGLGCLWVFINIFGSNHKRLLMDYHIASKRFQGTHEKKELTCPCESDQTLIGEEHVVNEACKNLVDESEEKFSEIIKRLIAQKEGEIQTCKDLLEAFHVLDSQEEEEESLLKEISHESLGDCKRVLVAEEEEEGEKHEVVSKKKHRNFFSRKWRSEEKRNIAQASKTIVVLKPGPSSFDVESSPRPHYTTNKSKSGRTFSRFLIGLIKRRLHSSVGKKSCDVIVDKSQNGCMQEETESKPVKHVSDEEEPYSKLDTVYTSKDSKMRMSSLYIAAKKHLSEMLANGDIDVNLPDKEVPRILGKILSLPEFSSPANSPTLIPKHDLVSPLIQTTEEPKILQCVSGSNDLTDEEVSEKNDETLCTIDISVPEGHEKETENMDAAEMTIIDPLPETCSSYVSPEEVYVDEVLEEEENKESLNKEMFNSANSLNSPPNSPPSSSERLAQCKETATDVQGKLSPVSVLEPLFTDDDSSSPTTSTRFSSAEMRIQPLCIRFDEPDSPKPDKANNAETSMDDKESTLAYIEAVVKSSGLSWEELLKRPYYSEQLLESDLTDDIAFSSTQLCDDKNLLYDCINEVLIDFCENELNPGPWISFVKPEVLLISDNEIAAKVAQEGVYWHLLPLPSPHTLDQIVRKDMARTGSWMDLRFDIGCICSGASEMILDDLVEEIIRSFRDMVQAEPMQDQNSNNLS